MLSTKQKLDILEKRFIIRRDAFVQQWFNEENGKNGYHTMVIGSCDQGCKRRLCEHVKPRPLNDNFIIDHLKGDRTIGVYNLSDESKVKWLCFDVDADKPGADVVNYTTKVVKEVYKLIGTRFLVEWSGNRGYHVWVFFDEPVEAIKARALGQYIESRIGYLEDAHIEIFPKQDQIKLYGNLVKLPLGVHLKTKQRSVFVNNKFEPYPLAEQWRLLTDVGTVTNEELDELVSTYKIPVETVGRAARTGLLTPPCVSRMMNEGASEGQRDEAGFRLACYLRDRGLSEEMTMAAMEEWNVNNDPPLDLEHLEAKINSAYSAEYSFFPCGSSLLDSFCSSSCRLWNRKVHQRWSRFGRDPGDAIGKISRD